MAKLCGFRWFLVSALLTGTAGCQSYKWLEGMDNYRAAEQRAREQNKCLFIFYKWWLDSASNRMLSGEVLSDPKVVALFQDTINLRVDRDFGPEYVEYMAKFGVNSLPASVIVAPNGKFKVQPGFTPKEQFIEFVKNAKASLSTQPERAPPPVP